MKFIILLGLLLVGCAAERVNPASVKLDERWHGAVVKPNLTESQEYFKDLECHFRYSYNYTGICINPDLTIICNATTCGSLNMTPINVTDSNTYTKNRGAE